jgi:uncharacterized Zn finger protein (UPF0148 family)
MKGMKMSDGYRCDMCDFPMSREDWRILLGICNNCLQSIAYNKADEEQREEINKRTEEYKNYLNNPIDPRD